MEALLIPQPDILPVSWGWFQLLLLVTFPLHLLAMNCMLGGLVLGVLQHIHGGEVQKRLAHRIALAAPLLIALTVNLGVAPFLFVQVLYGHFLYTSSVVMGLFWILVIPLLMTAYAGAYLYDFKFAGLGRFGVVVGGLVCLLLLLIAAFFSHNMLLMVLPERFGSYFQHPAGTFLLTDHLSLLPRYLHMVLGALAVGGLWAAALGNFQAVRDLQLAEHSRELGLKWFVRLTVVNIGVGVLYLLALPREQMLLFMGANLGATAAFMVALLLLAGMLVTAVKRKLWLTIGHLTGLVVVMTFMRSWLRSGYLREVFTLDQLQVIPHYSPLVFFVATFLAGVCCLAWLWLKTRNALAES